MHIDVDSLVKKMDVEKLIEENIKSNIIECVDIGDIVDNALEDEKVKVIISKRVVDIIEVYLSSDEGKKRVIEKFEEFIVDSDILSDDRITDMVLEFLKTSLTTRH